MAASFKMFQIGKFDLNPRGNLWAQDEETFGHKLLHKMGWSKGQGLGKNNNGITEHVKVRMKTKNTGVGWKDKLHAGIDAQEYDSVLESLNKKHKTNREKQKVQDSDSGLENRSQQFKNRLHYQKFVRGKDIRRYSEKDMKSIFFDVKNSNTKMETANQDVPESKLCDPSGTSGNVAQTYTSQLSVADYFAQKLKNKTGASQSKTEHKDISTPSSNCEETQTPNKRKKHRHENKKSKKIKLEVQEMVTMCEETDTSSPSENVSMDMKEDVGLASINGVQNGHETSSLKAEKKKKSSKNLKKTKLKKPKLEKLKSCLKKVRLTGWYEQENKNVSFNDKVFYKNIDENLIQDSYLNSTEDDKSNLLFEEDNSEKEIEENSLICNESCSDSELEDMSKSTACDPSLSENVSESINGDSPDATNDDSEDDDFATKPKCLDLPKVSNSNYNSWLESQRQATKMKLYKGMINNIKNHPILGKSNMLDLKGYGNWGF